MTMATPTLLNVPTQTVDFDYDRVVFGDEQIVNLNARTWGAIRMGR